MTFLNQLIKCIFTQEFDEAIYYNQEVNSIYNAKKKRQLICDYCSLGLYL